MSEEIRINEHHDCICQNKWFKKFLVMTLAVFVGGFCAMSLFCALHKPPMMMGAPYQYQMGGFGAYHHCDCPCHKMHMMKKFMKCNKDLKEKAPQEIDD